MSTVLTALILLQSFLITSYRHIAHGEVDHIEAFKSRNLLVLKSNGRILATYPAAFGYHPGKKEREGDKKTPEGTYHIIGKKEKSIFTHSLHISYPNDHDLDHAKKLGVDPGSEITIHGTGPDQDLKRHMRALKNWTRGCIGLHDHHVRELYRTVKIGTPITIHP